ncbi:hypothetical protein EDB87DRAFT_1684972 [Lactarius vividus]|nr:hypothetical protein EDB87DRAFT_1684972 [Lactarius vividus]
MSLDFDSKVLLSVIDHVFLPPKLPQQAPTEEAERGTNVALCHILMQAAQAFSQFLSPSQQLSWTHMMKTMVSMCWISKGPLVEAELKGIFSDLTVGDVFAMHVRAQNAAVIIRMLIDHVRFEIFEVSPPTSNVMSTNGKLLCSYPGPAVQISSDIFSKECFLQEVASFLIQMDVDVLDSAATIVKAESTVREVRESPHPRYISELLEMRFFGKAPTSLGADRRYGSLSGWRFKHPWTATCTNHLSSFFTHTSSTSASKGGFPSETLHLMRVKMARRLSKLGPAVSDDVYDAVYDAAKETETLLLDRWSSFQASESVSPPWRPEELDIVRDTAITLKNSRHYLLDALHPTSHSYPQKQFKPSHTLRLDTVDFSHFLDGRLTAAVAKEKRTALADFESSVERYLDSWVGSLQHDSSLSAPDVIASCIEQYYVCAREIYDANPEDNSIMILTIMDLWMALDKLTAQQCPLLTSYSPEIPRDFLHYLLLHRSGSLRRAMVIGEYILQRHRDASCTTSIFSDKAIESSFPVQYFRGSPKQQQLYAEINRHAEEQREKKRKRLRVLNNKWRSLKDAATNMDHNNHEGNQDHGRCKKCKKDNKADNLKIVAFEWPLPQATMQAQLVIFELSLPRAFSAWREITYKILCDIGLPSASGNVDRPELLLDAFSGLRNWAIRHKYHRITIGSTTKSFCDQTHYKTVKIPADDSDVLLNNGLSFRLYDRETKLWAARPFLGSNVAHFCTPPIPVSSPYSKIHSFVSETHHTSNEVIAGHADCPPELSSHEYMAFSGLRSGPRLQWLNIARELSSPSLSFRREEVHTLITQAAWQLGPLSDNVREWHTELGIPGFGWTILHELEGLLGRIEANWIEEVTVRTVALLTCRLLSAVRDHDVCERAYNLLRKARSVAHKWIHELGSKLDMAEEEPSRATLRRRLCTLAMTCLSTYDVCPEHVPSTLASDNDIAIAVHCAVIVHDNTPSIVEDGYLIRLLSRHHRLLHFLEPHLRECVQSNPSGFDNGLTSLWPGFRRQTTSNWHALPRPHSRWISCTVEGGKEVHYNILTGQLLIGGNPLGRLPQDIIQHSTYASVLGTRVLDVVPADIPEMEFMTRSNVYGHQIFFSRRDGNLTIQARRPEDPRLLQFVPRSVFVNDFPKAFVDDCVHWLDLGTGEVEFRPVESPWTPDPSNWRLTVDTDGARSLFRKISGDNAPVDLIDIRSATFQMISCLLSALDAPEHIIIMCTNHALEASLSRLHLAFFVNQDSELECRSFPGYVIDRLQSCGTMFGLRNQLVLCPSHGSSVMPRRVVIPQGDIEFGLDGDFSRVSIKTGPARHVYWHEYTIDTDLGRLTGNLSLHSKLYQCYLHALTSHCLPDPLLGHTGTEESLNMLRSAAFLSFQRLSNDDAMLLNSISNLTPGRVYYPPHLKSMVTVKWNDLPILSQHHDFHPAVLSILDHAHAMEALYDKPVVFEVPPRSASLLKRAASRNKVYYPYDLQNATHSSSSIPEDVTYKSRDAADGLTRAERVYQMSWSVWNDRPYLARKKKNRTKLLKLWDVIRSWKSLGPAEKEISLRYSRYWLAFDVAKDWLRIYDICQEALNRNSQDSKIWLAFSLSAAIFGGSNVNIAPLFLIFATDTRLRGLTRPPPSHFKLSDGVYPDHTQLAKLMSQFVLPMERTPAQTMEVQATANKKRKARQREEFDESISEKASEAARSTVERWPEIWCNPPDQWFDVQRCRENVKAYLQSISRNIDFRDHIHRLQAILNHYEASEPPTAPYVFSPQFNARLPTASSHSLREVLISRVNFSPPPSREQPSSGCAIPSSTVTIVTESNPSSIREDGLSSLIRELRQSRESLLQLYGEDLNKSYSDLLGKEAPFLVQRSVPPQEALLQYRKSCSDEKDAIFSELLEALAPSQKIEHVLSISGLWPRITPRSILRELSRERVHTLADQWKHAITRYAVAFLKYQQFQRLLELSLRHRDEELLQEAETACEDVAAACSPDWLLIQIDANFLARPLQVAIAREMISPSCQRSASLQLNMGEGKSSVVVPLVAATLADGSNLARIVTLKPLSNQMFQLLLSRLSDLADRRIFYVPFSRNLQMSASVVRSISTLYKQCAADGGVLVVQPEHLLSQKLMYIDTLVTSHEDGEKLLIANELKDLQRWLAEASRDVLDESDEILHVRYQLVYTAGEQMSVEDHPNRWSTTQQVFSRLRAHATQLHDSFPNTFELDQAQKGFPTMRILGREVFRQMSSLIVEDALGGALSTLPLAVLSPSIREATRRFITYKEVSVEDHELIRSHCSGTTLWSGILLLRGLLAEGEGVLYYALKDRRWRVDYGLDPSRTLLAVPYRAKDVPSLRAEFGHPDVAIALTYLSYYYGGLSKQQVLQCFDLLAKLDNPDMEYDEWVESGEGVPTSLRQVNGVNTKDDTQVDEHLFPLFSKNTRVIDFYLSQVVFPRAAKEFPSKLSTSAWDLVEDKSNVTTGFSGTNDNRYLLPTSITQEDPVSQLSTNALVLQYLLQPENNHYECTEGVNGERESAGAFLRRLVRHEPEIRVLLDVGAQMLELQNEELARHWLSLKPHVSAAIFFDESDHLTVLTQDGTIEPLISSPFNRQLDKCIVYLDDAHTRGTDLKLPRGTRAAVTLGPKVTKDRLLQGCMRMRQLGKGQSVMFFAPGEVDRRIRSLIPRGQEPDFKREPLFKLLLGSVGLGPRDQESEYGVHVIDILRWAMHETCWDIRHHLPHWAQQGVDHHRRFSAYKRYDSTGDLGVLRNSWLQRESRTLEEMYEPAPNSQVAGLSSDINSIPSLRERLERLGVTQLTDVRMAEEQEREANHEVERECHVEPPPRVHPAKHIIHNDLRNFVRTGSFPTHSKHIIPLFSQTGIDKALDSTAEWSPSPLATIDFTITTQGSNIVHLTDYLRPVNWILMSGSGRNSIAIIISPHEANELLPTIRKSGKVRLHVYAPRVTASMRSFSDLAFYTIPSTSATEWTAPAHLRIELNLFAGQLYFDSREQYQRVCELLALHMAHPGAKHVEVDGFVPPAHRTGESSPFSVSAISMFKTLTGLRRKGMGFGGTELGRVLDARPLSSDFDS